MIRGITTLRSYAHILISMDYGYHSLSLRIGNTVETGDRRTTTPPNAVKGDLWFWVSVAQIIFCSKEWLGGYGVSIPFGNIWNCIAQRR
jgi:hypothetical protein